jgi:Amt family ammonium transporter
MSFLLRGVGWRYVPALILLCIATSPACAGGAKVPDTGDTAWVLVASALVLFMTLPGLALFYGGLVRARNLLSVLMIASSFASATAGC